MTATGARSPAADDALVARFKEALARLWPGGGRLGLAVSGGPDSLAMLLLADAAIPGQFEVATVDHRLRPESADECAMVAGICVQRGIPCEVLTVSVPPGNVQSSARGARYTSLYEWAKRQTLFAIATAHHADDQAETLLMRLTRGSGLSGLAGIRERLPLSLNVEVIRPLLSFRRSELARVVADGGITVAHDPSNHDERFDRVRIRKALAQADWLDMDALAASARHLADAEEAVQHYEQHLLETSASAGRDYADFVPPVSREMQIRLAQWAIEEFGGSARGSDVAALVDRLREGRKGNVGGVLATVEGEKWVFRPEPPRRDS